MSHQPTRGRGPAGGNRMSAHRGGMHYCRGAGPYPIKLRPALLPDDYVEMYPSGETRRVEAFTVQPGTLAFSNDNSNTVGLTANSTNRDNEATELEMPDGWLGQFRMVSPGRDIPADVTVTVDHGGKEAPLYTTKNFRGQYDREAGTEQGHDGSSEVVGDDIMTHFLEYYVFEDEVPFFTFEETGGATPTVQDVVFAGYHYKLSEPETPPDDVFPVPLPVERVRE